MCQTHSPWPLRSHHTTYMVIDAATYIANVTRCSARLWLSCSPHCAAIAHAQSITRKRASSHMVWKSLSAGVKWAKSMSRSAQKLQLSAAKIAATTCHCQCFGLGVRYEQKMAARRRMVDGTPAVRRRSSALRIENVRGECASEMMGMSNAKPTSRRASFGFCVCTTYSRYAFSTCSDSSEPRNLFVYLLWCSKIWRTCLLTSIGNPTARMAVGCCREFMTLLSAERVISSSRPNDDNKPLTACSSR
mmetsp:Transcript_343/g.896  ORF Transcript_343/g.896 Transcript_343/m.896 type:complete len:247 (+) Transcript_343:1434-2174(+)